MQSDRTGGGFVIGCNVEACLNRSEIDSEIVARAYARDASEDESDVEDERGVEDEKGPWPVPPKQSAEMLC